MEIATPTRTSEMCLKLIRCSPPFTLTRNLLFRYHEFLGVDVRNIAIPDPFEMIVQPTHGKDVVMVATLKEVVTCSKDAIIGTYAWNSPGSSYDDWYDGSTITRRLVPRVSHRILEVNDPVFKALPALKRAESLQALTASTSLARGWRAVTSMRSSMQ
jgi:hypothetical protein